MLEYLRNLVVNLKATGPAAASIAWIIGIVTLGIYGEGELAESALMYLAIFGLVILLALTRTPNSDDE